MSLQQWANSGWLRPHQTSREELGNLLAIVDRDLADAGGGISADWRFGIAYNAALKLCTVLLWLFRQLRTFWLGAWWVRERVRPLTGTASRCPRRDQSGGVQDRRGGRPPSSPEVRSCRMNPICDGTALTRGDIAPMSW